jgi:hypothetical protein
MSVRAYVVKKIETGPEMFNLNHDEMIIDLLHDQIYESLNGDGCGITELQDCDIEDALDQAVEDKEELVKKYGKELYDYDLKALKTMLRVARKDGYLTLYCY